MLFEKKGGEIMIFVSGVHGVENRIFAIWSKNPQESKPTRPAL